MTYFSAELVQLIVSWSDSELEVQRYGMKKNTLTVDPVMLEDELWMRQREKPSPNCQSQIFENQTLETEFSVFEFWGQFGSVRFLENWYPTFSLGSTHPYPAIHARLPCTTLLNSEERALSEKKKKKRLLSVGENYLSNRIWNSWISMFTLLAFYCLLWQCLLAQ